MAKRVVKKKATVSEQGGSKVLEQLLERIAIALETLVAKTEEAPAKETTTRTPRKEKPAPPVDLFGEGPKAPVITIDEVRAALRAYMEKNGQDATKALMIACGADPVQPKITSIPEASWPKVMELVKG